MQGEWGFF